MTTAIAEREANGRALSASGRAALTADALQSDTEQRALLMRYVAGHMVEGTDYGVIPGTTKKTLLKPGAEKLTDLFRCTPHYTQTKCIEDWEKPLFFYEFTCSITLRDSDTVLAHGVGSCNTRESRYRWRNADRVCPACDKPAIKRSKFPPRDDPEGEPGWYCYGKAGGCGANFYADDSEIVSQPTGRVENPDLFDTINTVLKVAKKRALVDAAIALARCSDMFTQDLEDFADKDHGKATAGRKADARPAKPRNHEQHAAAFRSAKTLEELKAAVGVANAVWKTFDAPQQESLTALAAECKAKLTPPAEPQQTTPAAHTTTPPPPAGKLAEVVAELRGPRKIDGPETLARALTWLDSVLPAVAAGYAKGDLDDWLNQEMHWTDQTEYERLAPAVIAAGAAKVGEYLRLLKPA